MSTNCSQYVKILKNFLHNWIYNEYKDWSLKTCCTICSRKLIRLWMLEGLRNYNTSVVTFVLAWCSKFHKLARKNPTVRFERSLWKGGFKSLNPNVDSVEKKFFDYSAFFEKKVSLLSSGAWKHFRIQWRIIKVSCSKILLSHDFFLQNYNNFNI